MNVSFDYHFMVLILSMVLDVLISQSIIHQPENEEMSNVAVFMSSSFYVQYHLHKQLIKIDTKLESDSRKRSNFVGLCIFASVYAAIVSITVNVDASYSTS